MTANFTIVLTPTSDKEETQAIDLDDVELGFNQLGWLVATDKRRDIVASFAPGAVRFAIKEESEGATIPVEEANVLIFGKKDEEPSIN